MGTNYYWHPKSNPCPTCGHDPAEPIHIGKSSAGWEFSFHGTDQQRSWKDWQKELNKDGRIVNEYGDVYSLEDFRKVVEERSHPNGLRNHFDYCAKQSRLREYNRQNWKDAEGYSFSPHDFS